MSKQTIVIESAKELSLSDGMIVIKDKESEEIILRPIEDVQMVMIDHHSARVTTPLITRLAKNNASVIYCDETHMPVSMTMDLDSNTIQSKRFQYQLSASVPTNKQLWKQIIEAKILNQSLLLEKLGKGQKLLAKYYSNVKSGDSTNREGLAAKMYWKILMGKDFIRDRYGAPPNVLRRILISSNSRLRFLASAVFPFTHILRLSHRSGLTLNPEAPTVNLSLLRFKRTMIAASPFLFK